MTTVTPNHHGTASSIPPVLVDTPRARAQRVPFRESTEPHGLAQLGAAIAAFAAAWFAVLLYSRGWAWGALPMAVLAVGILLGAFLPAFLGARYDRQRAEQEAAEAGA